MPEAHTCQVSASPTELFLRPNVKILLLNLFETRSLYAFLVPMELIMQTRQACRPQSSACLYNQNVEIKGACHYAPQCCDSLFFFTSPDLDILIYFNSNVSY